MGREGEREREREGEEEGACAKEREGEKRMCTAFFFEKTLTAPKESTVEVTSLCIAAGGGANLVCECAGAAEALIAEEYRTG